VATYVIIPGIDDSDESHWQSRWQRGWADAAIRISPTSWSQPDLTDWVHAVQAAHDEACAQLGPVFLVAHGLGCWAAVTWLGRSSSSRMSGVLLVAPPDPLGAAFPTGTAPSFRQVTAQPLPCPALLVASSDDPHCTVEAAAGFAEGWEAHLHLVSGRCHMNSASGLGEWPEGRQLLNSLTWHRSN
jgi:predicted alpha/beta hydrolase family esterase